MTEWDRFLEFESKNRLFDYCDNNGVCVWDLVRSLVYSGVMGYKAPTRKGGDDVKKRVLSQIKALPLLFKWIFSKHKDYFFFLTSRNKKGNLLFDQIAEGPLSVLGYNNCYLVESYADPTDRRLIYPFSPCPSIADLFRFVVRKKIDFSEIVSVVKSIYPDIDININAMQLAYKRFYGQRMFYGWLFKQRHFKAIFVVQNNLQKGMIYTARKMGIQVIELQHGIVNKSHMAYSYPQGYKDLNEKIYTPNKVLSFAPFWFKDVYNPGCRFIPIGNDNLAPSISRSKIHRKSFVVVSADVFGKDLADLVNQLLNDKRTKDYQFYFKLHPNQFWQLDEYYNKFEEYDNVEVISNQKSMQDLLGIVESMIVITSTAVYEALYAGVKVFVYKRLSYEVHLDVVQQKGVYFVDNAKELVDSYEASRNLEMTPDSHYFSKFDKQAFLDAIKN